MTDKLVKKKKRRPAPVLVTQPDGSTETVPASRFTRRRARRYVFSLTAAQRSALFAGEMPRITVPSDDCPFEPGDVYEIPGTKNMAIGIIGIAEGGNGRDVLLYKVFDRRPRLLRASVHGVDFESIRRSFDDRGVPAPLNDAAAVADAAEQSAYTSSPGASLKGEPEAISRADQEDQVQRAREKTERKIRSPIAAIEERLLDLEDDPLFAQQVSTLRFLRNRLARLCDDRLREEGIG